MRTLKNVVIATACIFLIPAVGFTIYRGVRDQLVNQMSDEKYQIDTIIQTGLIKKALPTMYLAELLELSVDRPTNFFTFDTIKAAKKLLQSPLIKHARVSKQKPSSVYVDYEIRSPIAVLADFSNVAVDAEGYSFPMAPFYSPTKIPEIFLDLKELSNKIEGEKIALALSIYKILDEVDLQGARLKRIDVSKAFSESFGKREIILQMENHHQTQILRMSDKNFKTELRNYLSIKDKMIDTKEGKGALVLDLRIAKLAFIEHVPHE